MKQLIKYAIPLLVVALHYFTGWAWILYFLMALYVIIIIILGVALYALRNKTVETEGKLTNTQLTTMTLNCILYVVYFNNIVLTSLIVITIPLVFYIKKLCTKK